MNFLTSSGGLSDRHPRRRSNRMRLAAGNGKLHNHYAFTWVTHTCTCKLENKCRPVSQKILSHLVILSIEKTMVTKVISELKSISGLKGFSRN